MPPGTAIGMQTSTHGPRPGVSAGACLRKKALPRSVVAPYRAMDDRQVERDAEPESGEVRPEREVRVVAVPAVEGRGVEADALDRIAPRSEEHAVQRSRRAPLREPFCSSAGTRGDRRARVRLAPSRRSRRP
jgi:hypothetical protein